MPPTKKTPCSSYHLPNQSKTNSKVGPKVNMKCWRVSYWGMLGQVMKRFPILIIPIGMILDFMAVLPRIYRILFRNRKGMIICRRMIVMVRGMRHRELKLRKSFCKRYKLRRNSRTEGLNVLLMRIKKLGRKYRIISTRIKLINQVFTLLKLRILISG